VPKPAEAIQLFSRRVVLPDAVVSACLSLRDGRIEAVSLEASCPPRARDLGEWVISPGLVDCHVHLNEPGRTEWEGFDTGTRAAAAGGVTTLIDMPLNCLPVTTNRAALEQKLAACEGQCFVDVGFWGGVVPDNTDALAGLRDAGALGCKAFMVHSGIDEFPNATERDLRRAMPVLRALGLPLLAHAELDLGAPPPSGDPRIYQGYLDSRPRAWEDAAIELLIQLCRDTGCAVHVVHLSSASALPSLRQAKAEGLPITVETCPHYLCLHAESIPHGATHFKCAPPIRERENCEALWSALFEGVIDFVITDHSPCTPQLKLAERGDFQAAWGGISSLQLGLSSVWTEASQRGANLSQLSAWMSERPARFAGLGTQKGRIQPGYDADLVIWDPETERTVLAEELHFRHKLSPYVGTRQRGRIVETWLRGRQVYAEGQHVLPASGQPLLHRRNAT
jgi:allantoinase